MPIESRSEPLLLEEDLSPSEGWHMNVPGSVLSNIRVPGGEERAPAEALAPGTIPITIRVKAAFQLLPHPFSTSKTR